MWQEKQNRYDYHDCDPSARSLDLYQNKETWKRLMDKNGYDEPTSEHNPF